MPATPGFNGFSNEPLHPAFRLAIWVLGPPLILHLALRQWPKLVHDPSWFGKVFWCFAWAEYWAARFPTLAAVLAVGLVVGGVKLWRRRVLARSARFTENTTGLADERAEAHFPRHDFDPMPYLYPKHIGGLRAPGLTFVGLTPKSRLTFRDFGKAWRPVWLTEAERSMHRHVLGKTGSGKTTSILWPQVLQDAYDGKGVLVMDAKGSDENARTMRAIARLADREDELRILSLPAWNRPELFSHTYNMVGLSASAPDVAAMAERVFSVFELGDNPYYRTQGFLAFSRVCRVLHGLGHPFNLQDVGVCLRGLSSPKHAWGKALGWCQQHTRDGEAAEELSAQVHALGNDAGACLSGLVGAVDRFQSPLVNAYAPDLVLEKALERNQLVYAQLPSNLYKLQAPALGKVLLMDLQQEASLRQVFRGQRNQTPFSVCIDEFGSFADLSLIDSLNKLRDAHIQFTLSHQSMADLELVSKEFAQSVLDNTRTRDVLALDNPELAERLAKSLGTYARLEHTVQQAPESLFSVVAATGAMSTRAVEAYRLHPNRLKTLAARGQGYLFATRAGGATASPVVYAPMPELDVEFEGGLARRGQTRVEGLRLRERFVNERK